MDEKKVQDYCSTYGHEFDISGGCRACGDCLIPELNNKPVADKYDYEKLPVYQGFIQYFPHAIEAVAAVSQAGAKKYANSKFPTRWRDIPEWEGRLQDAQARHMLEEAKGNPVDEETHCLHLAQQAWNALARLELQLTGTKEVKNSGCIA